MKWTKYDQCGWNGPNWTQVDQIELKWTEEDRMDQIGLLIRIVIREYVVSSVG